MKNKISITALLAFTFLVFEFANAQHQIKRSVLGNGGGASSNNSYRISATLGQPLTGISSSNSNTVKIGFWYSNGDFVDSIEETTDLIPREFRLEQNYPNPFNPSTTIAFSIAKSATVRLALFDLLGREVFTLRDERMQPGEYRFTFEAGDLASGVYFYRLTATDVDNKSHVFTKKLTLLK